MRNCDRHVKSKYPNNWYSIPVGEVVLHPLVETHPVMSTEQFEALKKSLEENSQIEPVTIYRGKVVDGRHRYKALMELDADVVYATSLPNNTKLQDVQKLVAATETRRHQSATQLAVKAYDYWKEYKCTQAEAVKVTGGSLPNLQHVAKIARLGRLDVINRLRSGGKVDVSDVKGVAKYTDSLLAIVQMLTKEQTSAVPVDRETTLTAQDYVKIDAVALLVRDWTPEEKKALIAKMYDTL